ncbi:hemolysin family protein [Rhabdothermincola salaria]|uniref:hemolysin family protein n=1 Tax=Rhabdothermincola salaria TaxID=2903142 RepID=UPI001E622192|nr:hemolysin family protein [Rhabdothermincola salaria]
MNVWALAAVVVLLVVNGYFVALEFAVVGSRRSRLEPLAEAGDRRAQHGLEAIADLSTRLAGAQLGITVASLLLGMVGEPAVAAGFEMLFENVDAIPEGAVHAISFAVALAIVVFLHMVIGEMVPKNLALADPERALKALAGIDRAFLKLARPVVRLLNAFGNVVVRLTGVEPRDEIASARTAEELAAVVATSREGGAIEDFAADLLTGVLDFSGRTVDSVMVHRDQVCALPRDTTVAEAEAMVVERAHTRLPLTGPGGLDDVMGFVHAKDLLTLAAPAADRPIPLRLVRRMLVVPVDRSLEDVMLVMRRSRVHFALVQHFDGTTAGIVTLDDLLEELVGDLVDGRHERDADTGEATGDDRTGGHEEPWV